MMDQQASDPGQRAAHRLLAEELTGRVHGADTARRVVAASRLLFGGQDLRAAEATVFQTWPMRSPPCGWRGPSWKAFR